MSRRSAVDTDTGTTGATFARAEPGLGSPPPQPDRDTLSNRRSPSQEFVGAWNCRRTDSTEGCRKAEVCLRSTLSGLREAVVIRGPLSRGKNNEFSIIVVVHGSMPKGLTFKFQQRLRNIAPLNEKARCRFLLVLNQFYPQTKEALRSFTKNYLR